VHIPLAAPDIGSAEIAAVKAVLESGCLSRGPELEAFEAITASRTRRNYAVGVSSGSAALRPAPGPACTWHRCR